MEMATDLAIKARSGQALFTRETCMADGSRPTAPGTQGTLVETSPEDHSSGWDTLSPAFAKARRQKAISSQREFVGPTQFGRKGLRWPTMFAMEPLVLGRSFPIAVSKDSCLMLLSAAGVVEGWQTFDSNSTFLGYLPEDAEGWPLETLVGPPQQRQKIIDHESPGPFLVRGKGGTQYYVTAQRLGEGVLMRDVTRVTSEAEADRVKACCSVLDGAHDAVLVVNEAARVVFGSLQAQRMLGFAKGDLLGQPIAGLLPEFAGDFPVNGPVPLRTVRQDGSSFIAETRVTRWEHQAVTFWIVWLRDRSAEVSVRGAERQMERGFRALIGGVEEYAIFTLTPDGRVATWNLGAQRISGYRAAEVIGQHVALLYPSEARLANRPEQALEAAKRDGLFLEEAERLRKDGSRFLANVALTAVRGRRGELRGFTKVTRDVTALRQEAQQGNERSAAAEREQIRRRFVQIAAHEFRNPMAGVKGTLGLVRDRIASGRPIRSPEDLLDMMEREVNRLAELADGILDAFHTEDPSCPFDLVPYDLREAVQAALGPFKAAGTRSFAVDLGKDPAPVNGDVERLAQVFRNLLSNAVKYSSPGSTVGVRLRREQACLRVTVWDHGIGIPAQDLPLVFKDFFRASNLKGRDPGGMGLGLQLCRHIVDRHLGRIWLESVENLGTRVHVSLPRLEV